MASIKALKDSNNETVYPQTLTNAVFDLSNQSLDNLLALKIDANRVYTKEEINNIVNTLSSLKFEVLQKNEDETIPDLPAVGDTDTIYLRPKENDDTNNYYDEYIYLENGTYEKIGDTRVDLSNYYTKTESDTNFAKLSLYSDTTINIGRKADTTIGSGSVAEGTNTTASGYTSHAEGFYTTASGNYSHAEGSWSEASGSASHAEGGSTTASGVDSHAEGSDTTASGEMSHAEGLGAIASGRWSHAEGVHTQAASRSQHVQGEYNIIDADNTYAHIAGNGSSSTKRSNAHTLDWDGNAWFEGDVYVSSTSGTNKDEGSKKLATEEYIVNNAMPKSDIVTAFWSGTQTEYDSLATKDATTLYMITG